MADKEKYLAQLESGVVDKDADVDSAKKDIQRHRELLEMTELELKTVQEEFDFVKGKFMKITPEFEYEKFPEYWNLRQVYAELTTRKRVMELENQKNQLLKVLAVKEDSLKRIEEAMKSD